jgi:hypothetical protein
MTYGNTGNMGKIAELGGQCAADGVTFDEAKSSVKGEYEKRKAALRLVQLRSPKGRLAKRAGVLMMDLQAFEDRVEESGGNEGFLYFVVAQVASGVTLREISGHYAIEYGLLWAWMGAEPERMARYEFALKGLADSYVVESVGMADATDPDEVALGKLRVDTRLKVAGVLDRKRFGTEKAGAAAGTGSLVIDAALTFAASELLARIQAPMAPRVIDAGDLAEAVEYADAAVVKESLTGGSADDADDA